jgi:hypothetical protein
MNGTTHKIRRAVSTLAVAVGVALVAIPAGQSRNTLVDDYFRDAPVAQPQNTIVDDYFRDASQAQPQNTLVDDYFRDASVARPQNTIVDDYFRDAPRAQPQNTIVDDYFRDTPPLRGSSNDGVNWGKVGIEIAVAVCGLLLLVALGIGTHQLRHGGRRLRRA